jgi:hypothetical protein
MALFIERKKKSSYHAKCGLDISKTEVFHFINIFIEISDFEQISSTISAVIKLATDSAVQWLWFPEHLLYFHSNYGRNGSRDDSFSIVTRLWAGGPRNGGAIPGWEKRNIFYSNRSSLDVRHNQPPIQWGIRNASQKVKWLKCEADHSPALSDEVKNEWT